MATLNEEQVEALLGRPLSEPEARSFTPWMTVAEARLKNLLCLDALDGLGGVESLLLARLFEVTAREAEQASKDAASYGIQSKRVEDFQITFDDGEENQDTAYATFVKDNADLIASVSKCRKIRLGKVRPLYDAYPL